MAASAQVVSPPTPGGFKTRNLGGGADVNTTPSTAPSNNTALIQTLRMRVDGLMRQRRYDEAQSMAMDLLKLSPNDDHAISCLQQIQAAQAAAEAPLKRMIVPSLELREASLQDVLKYLQEISAGLTADKKPICFVLQLPPGTSTSPVTLSLHNVPMLDVIRFVTAVAGLTFRVEPYAVVICKQPPPPAPAPAVPVAP
jgi:hypothetical protein